MCSINLTTVEPLERFVYVLTTVEVSLTTVEPLVYVEC